MTRDIVVTEEMVRVGTVAYTEAISAPKFEGADALFRTMYCAMFAAMPRDDALRALGVNVCADHSFHEHISRQLCGPVKCATCGATVDWRVSTDRKAIGEPPDLQSGVAGSSPARPTTSTSGGDDGQAPTADSATPESFAAHQSPATSSVDLVARLRNGDNRVCPFEQNAGDPDDPCPICGDLGHYNAEKAPRCITISTSLLHDQAASAIEARDREIAEWRMKVADSQAMYESASIGRRKWQCRAEEAEAALAEARKDAERYRYLRLSFRYSRCIDQMIIGLPFIAGCAELDAAIDRAIAARSA